MHAVAKPHNAALHRLRFNELERLAFRRLFAFLPSVAHDRRNAGEAVDAWEDEDRELVDEAGLEEAAVDEAAALKKNELRAEGLFNRVERARKRLIAFALEDIGNADAAKFRQVAFSGIGRENGNEVLAGCERRT